MFSLLPVLGFQSKLVQPMEKVSWQIGNLPSVLSQIVF